jgi:hypothetical protein
MFEILRAHLYKPLRGRVDYWGSIADNLSKAGMSQRTMNFSVTCWGAKFKVGWA